MAVNYYKVRHSISISYFRCQYSQKKLKLSHEVFTDVFAAKVFFSSYTSGFRQSYYDYGAEGFYRPFDAFRSTRSVVIIKD